MYHIVDGFNDAAPTTGTERLEPAQATVMDAVVTSVVRYSVVFKLDPDAVCRPFSLPFTDLSLLLNTCCPWRRSTRPLRLVLQPPRCPTPHASCVCAVLHRAACTWRFDRDRTRRGKTG